MIWSGRPAAGPPPIGAHHVHFHIPHPLDRSQDMSGIGSLFASCSHQSALSQIIQQVLKDHAFLVVCQQPLPKIAQVGVMKPIPVKRLSQRIFPIHAHDGHLRCRAIR